jgi:hypothetical protein
MRKIIIILTFLLIGFTAISHEGTTYYVPEEIVANINYNEISNWYLPATIRTVAQTQSIYNTAKTNNSNLLLSLIPDINGVISDAQFNTIAGIVK